GRRERRKAVLSSLVKYLGPEAASSIHYEEKDWAKEDYSGGCPVNVMAPGLLTYYHPSLRKPCGRIHWAGTETATQWCGYMSGAVQAGQRAALEVLAELCPMVLTQEEQETVQHGQTVKSPAKQTPSKLMYLSSYKAMVIASLTISAALFLAQHPNALLKVTNYLTNVLSATRHNTSLV
ncbi:amine oxidase [flavin-containing]-like, partial [Micropterus salmoides]|uniref:amine oxidase [flavin-containing]-like n=1 Tax=Micropterus salmoides TaxID=27706 RepID=UPI0018EBB29B